MSDSDVLSCFTLFWCVYFLFDSDSDVCSCFLLLMCFRYSCALFLNVFGICSAQICACLYVVQILVVFPMCLIVCIDIFIFRYVFDVFPFFSGDLYVFSVRLGS